MPHPDAASTGLCGIGGCTRPAWHPGLCRPPDTDRQSRAIRPPKRALEAIQNAEPLNTVGSRGLRFDKTIVSKRIRIYWESERRWYKGVVKEFDPVSQLHTVLYDDGEQQHEALQPGKTPQCTWEALPDTDVPPAKQPKRSANTKLCGPGPEWDRDAAAAGVSFDDGRVEVLWAGAWYAATVLE